MKEAVEVGDFELEYKATTEILADSMTKGKQGKDFIVFRSGAGIQRFNLCVITTTQNGKYWFF